MKQHRMTAERGGFTREDMANMLKNGPEKGKGRSQYVSKVLKAKGLSKDEIDKLLTDLDSY